jgi:hypothetical protein
MAAFVSISKFIIFSLLALSWQVFSAGFIQNFKFLAYQPHLFYGGQSFDNGRHWPGALTRADGNSRHLITVYAPLIKCCTLCTLIRLAMNQISIKTPNPKCRLFLKIDQEKYLAAGPLPSQVFAWGGKAIS